MISRRLFLQASGLSGTLRQQEVLRFVFSRPYDNPRTQWLISVYREVCAMVGVGFEFIDVPPCARRPWCRQVMPMESSDALLAT